MSNSKKDSIPNKTKLTTTHKILITGVIVILCSVGVLAMIILNTQKVEPNSSERNGTIVINEDNLGDLDEMQKIPQGQLNVSMTTSWSFDGITEPSKDAYVANVKENRDPFYIEVSSKDTKEVFYTSGIIPVGSYLKEIVLEKQDLLPGTYPAVCSYKILDEKGLVYDSLDMAISIIIR
jgi:hypothetical protein